MFTCDPNSTGEPGKGGQCRWRLRNPQDFSKMWTEYAWKGIKSKGLSYIVGLDKNNKKGVQAVRFDRQHWSEKESSGWWEEHKDKFKKTWTQSDWDKSKNGKEISMLDKVASILWEDSTIILEEDTFVIVDSEENRIELTSDGDFIEYMVEHGESESNAISMMDSLKEETKLAALIKYAKEELIFKAEAAITFSLDNLDLEIDDAIRAIKVSDATLDDKVAKGKEIVKNIAVEELNSNLLTIDGVGIDINFSTVDMISDSIDWYELFAEEEIDEAKKESE